jgi:hypothetical protein
LILPEQSQHQQIAELIHIKVSAVNFSWVKIARYAPTFCDPNFTESNVGQHN